MKTAISIQDSLLEAVDHTARTLGVNRSRLFSMAAEEFLKRRRQEDVLAALNRAYSGDDQTEELRLAKAAKARLRSSLRSDKRPW